MANQSLAGTLIPRNSAPLVTRGVPNGNGLYPWSAFTAPLYTVIDGAPVESTISANDALLLFLLFTCDIPVSIVSREQPLTNPYLGTVELPNTAWTEVGTNVDVTFVSTTPSGLVPSTVEPGVPVFGYTGDTGNVPCSGFPAAVVTTAHGLRAGDTPEDDPVSRAVQVTVISNSAVVNGPAPISSNTLQSVYQRPILLDKSFYTQAILDAGNVIVVSPTERYVVVGLYNTFSSQV